MCFSGEGLYPKMQYLGREKLCDFPVVVCTQNAVSLRGNSSVVFRRRPVPKTQYLCGEQRCGFPVWAALKIAESWREKVMCFSGEGLYSKRRIFAENSSVVFW